MRKYVRVRKYLYGGESAAHFALERLERIRRAHRRQPLADRAARHRQARRRLLLRGLSRRRRLLVPARAHTQTCMIVERTCVYEYIREGRTRTRFEKKAEAGICDVFMVGG